MGRKRKYTHVIESIADYDAYYGCRDKMVGMKVYGIDEDGFEEGCYSGVFQLSKVDRKRINEEDGNQFFYSAVLKEIN